MGKTTLPTVSFHFKEKVIEASFFFCSSLCIFINVAIIAILVYESYGFFQQVSIVEFLTGTEWTPFFYEKHYGILPLFAGTFLTTIIAIAIALPIGLISAVYLSEYSGTRFRTIVKPLLEMIAAVPTVVYGYFALLFVTPMLQNIFPNLASFNALSPGIVMGIMIIPLIASLSEDAIHAVPLMLREGAYALGATRLQVVRRVLIPAAYSGIASSVILGISRAIGETMIVAIAAGGQPRLTLDPTVPIQTITAYIVQVGLGDAPAGTIEYQTIFVVGASLFVVTFLLNTVSYLLRKRFQHAYE